MGADSARHRRRGLACLVLLLAVGRAAAASCTNDAPAPPPLEAEGLMVNVPPEQEEAGAVTSHAPRRLCAHTPANATHAAAWSCSNWAGTVRWSPASLVVPASEEELVAYLRGAADTAAAHGQAPPPLKVVGFAHSWAGIFVPGASNRSASGASPVQRGTTVALHKLSGITRLSANEVEVLAGTSFATLFAELAARGLALAWAPGGIQGLTVGGAVSVGFHGSQASLGGVSSVVRALRLVDTSGGVHDLSDAADPEAMRAARMGLGMCGILTRVTLPVVPQFHLRRRRWRVDDAAAFLDEQLDGLKAQHDRFHWYLHPATGSAWPMLWEDATAEESAAEGRPCRTALEQHEDAAEKEFGVDGLPLIMRWDNCSDVSHRSLTHAVDMEQQPLWNGEYYLPVARTEDEAAATRAILARFAQIAEARDGPGATPSQHLWLHTRYVAGDTASLLNPCYGDTTCAAFELALVAPSMDAPLPPWDEWAAYFSAMEDVLRGLGGRPHHAKYRSTDPPLQRGFGLPVDEFAAQCARFDPQHMLRNEAFDALFAHPPAATTNERVAQF